MIKLFELKASKSHYYFVMNKGYYIKKKLNQGTITLIGLKDSEEKYNNGFSIIYNYKYLCRSCGWDFTSMDTFGRAGFKPIQCPNCGYNHLPEGTVKEDNKEKIIPVYYNIVLYSTDNSVILEMKSKGTEDAKSKWEAKERIAFNIQDQDVEWQLENMVTGTSCSQKIGYLDDNIEADSGFACLTINNKDDHGHSVKELCELLIVEVLSKMKQFHKAKRKALMVTCSDTRKAFFHTLLKVAHYTRFWDAPDARLYGKDISTQEWYRNNDIGSRSYYGFEHQLEENIRSKKLSYYDAALNYFKLPHIEAFRKLFSYKNIGFYKEIENRFADQELAKLVLVHGLKLPVSQNNLYSNTSSLRQIYLKGLVTMLKNYPQLKKEVLADIVGRVANLIKNIKVTEEYKAFFKSRVRDREGYILNKIETKVAEEVFHREIQRIAETEKKDFNQVLCEQLDIPNTPVLREYYKFELVKAYQTIYHKYKDLREANELIKIAFKVYMDTRYRKHEAVNDYLDFYESFKNYYPGIITPAYAGNYILNPNNNPGDCVRMLGALNDKSLAKFKEAKPRMKKLHDYLKLLTNLQLHPEKLYEIPEDVRRRTEMYLKNMKLKVLDRYSDIFKAGQSLHNCAASYRDIISSQHYLVLATDDKGLPKALLEINNNAIVQAKLMNNKPVHNSPDIQEIVLEFAGKGGYRIDTNDIQLNDMIIETATG